MHPNDTLNGRLLAWELPTEKHLRHRFGYWHNVEQRMIEVCLALEGITRETDRFFFVRLSKAMEANHRDDPKPWHNHRGLMHGGAIRQQAQFEIERTYNEAKDAALDALRQIEAGHNDPRALARQVLAMLPISQQPT